MKQFVIKVVSSLILLAGSAWGIAVSFGEFKADYSHVKERVTTVEKKQEYQDKKIDRMYGHLEYLRGRFDKTYNPEGD